ncbi:hypothetical protein D2962_08295 [Biomaibacter acetigenes]|uniref:Uncharacterized protein n=1 Tax=Biomaibacter acetigenes TaxID=2316383 RepID=A0A3G2R581_9FIRM|nr:hypothetical protein [Biomaibacter acetigenes]AYO30623.1 hypothetical protein D2962_08295 [Biomaibacter acetigenes]
MKLAPGTAIKARNKGVKHEWKLSGRIIKEYPSFFLVWNENGYRETILKALIETGDIIVVEG